MSAGAKPLTVTFSVAEALTLRDELQQALARSQQNAAELGATGYPELQRILEFDNGRFQRALAKIEKAIAQRGREIVSQ